MEAFKRFLNKNGEGGVSTKFLIALGLAGLLLLCLTSLPKRSAAPADQSEAASSRAAAAPDSAEPESKLEAMVESVAGAGKARVMITYETAENTVYAVDTKSTETGSEESHVLLKNGVDGLVETVWMPEVRGVAVVCQGADSPAVAAQITEMLSVLLGVSANRISIAKMN